MIPEKDCTSRQRRIAARYPTRVKVGNFLVQFLGFFRPGVWMNLFRAKGKGIAGNMEGEGRILGGLFVVNKEKGIVFHYAEKEFGDHADIKDVLDAAKRVANNSIS